MLLSARKRYMSIAAISAIVIYGLAILFARNTMFGYQVCGSYTIESNTIPKNTLIDRTRQISDKFGANFISKSLGDYNGQQVKPYTWVNMGFCTLNNCLSISNDFLDHQYLVYVYYNSLIPFFSERRCELINKEIENEFFK